MKTPSRREFFTYAAAATLASGCRSKHDQTQDPASLPLVVDVIGPMALKWSGPLFELWMPDLSAPKPNNPGITPHQAGILTAKTGIQLTDSGKYQITGPSDPTGTPAIYAMPNAEVYQAKVTDTSAPNKYIYMSLPKPACVVVLDPVSATISGSAPTASGNYAVGVRLFYNQANTPVLSYPDGTSVTIPLYASPCEKQTSMLIGYLPYDSADPKHDDAKASFREVSLLFPPLDLQVAFAPVSFSPSTKVVPFMGPFHDCKSPVIGLSG